MQVGILASGNYSYYNLLYIVLCLSLLDDHTFYRGKNSSLIIVYMYIILYTLIKLFNFTRISSG